MSKIQIDIELYSALIGQFLGNEDNTDFIIEKLKEREKALQKHALYSLIKKENITELQKRILQDEYKNL